MTLEPWDYPDEMSVYPPDVVWDDEEYPFVNDDEPYIPDPYEDCYYPEGD